jgi:hypothetical protein
MNIRAQTQPVDECRRAGADDVWRDCIIAAKRAADARHRLEVALEQLNRARPRTWTP